MTAFSPPPEDGRRLRGDLTMLRVTLLFGGLTVLFLIADRTSGWHGLQAMKPLFWTCAAFFAALLIRISVELVRGIEKARRPHPSMPDKP
jgi:hypothetical protein